MAKRKKSKQRPFRPEVLQEHVVDALRPRMGPGEILWRFTLTVPLEEVRPVKRQKATSEDLYRLAQRFAQDFGGFTRLPNSLGYGLRDPTQLHQVPEMNYNAYFAVLASPVPEAEAYFRALREELEDALEEGVILVERQEVWIP
jgi:hypothetical protein